MSKKKYDFSQVPQDKIEAVLTFAIDQNFHFDGLLSDLQQHVRVVETKADVARELAELCAVTFDHTPSPHSCHMEFGEANPFRVLVGRYRKAVDG